MKRHLLICFIMINSVARAIGQESAPRVVNASGGSFKDGNIIYEWSVGELALVDEMRSADDNAIVTNGFLQGIIANIKKDTLVKPISSHEVVILPNPTKGKLQVYLNFLQVGVIRMIMYDETGFVLYKKEVASPGAAQLQTIHMDNFTAGNYFLWVELSANNNSAKKRQTFKIIKVH